MAKKGRGHDFTIATQAQNQNDGMQWVQTIDIRQEVPQ